MLLIKKFEQKLVALILQIDALGLKTNTRNPTIYKNILKLHTKNSFKI